MNTQISNNLGRRKLQAKLFVVFCSVVTLLVIFVLAMLLYEVLISGWSWLDWQFITSLPSRFPVKAGIMTALYGTVWLLMLTASIAIPVGVFAAVYLEEYAPKNKFSGFVELNIANLAGVPSVVYGILGLAIFVRFMDLRRSLLAAALTLSLLILPVIIISAKEAIRAVPLSIRQAAYAIGATRWQVVSSHVLPAAIPGILTGVILSLSRAIGETAPLIVIGALTYVAFIPESPLDEFTTLPIQIYNWTSRPQEAFHELAAAGIIVLLLILLSMNALAVYIRQRTSK